MGVDRKDGVDETCRSGTQCREDLHTSVGRTFTSVSVSQTRSLVGSRTDDPGPLREN